jgi:hypothetical protein
MVHPYASDDANLDTVPFGMQQVILEWIHYRFGMKRLRGIAGPITEEDHALKRCLT